MVRHPQCRPSDATAHPGTRSAIGLLVASAAMLVMLPVPLLAQENGTFEVQAIRASEPIIMDGELTEEDWTSAEPRRRGGGPAEPEAPWSLWGSLSI